MTSEQSEVLGKMGAERPGVLVYEISLSSTTCSNNCSLEDDDDFLGNNEQCLAQTLLEFLDFL